MTVQIVDGANSYKIPNPMTVEELMAEGKTLEQAKHIMAEKVFGVNYSKDKDGNPVENGKGSALQPTQQHLDAIKVNEIRNQMAGKASSEQAEIIAKAVAAGVQMGMKAARDEERL